MPNGAGGGGGGGTIVGASNSFTGPAQALELIGNHAYAYNQATSSGNSTPDVTMLKFTTGNYYFVGRINYADVDSLGYIRMIEIDFNGETIYSNFCDDAPNGFYSPITTIIIPAYTEFQLKFGISGVTAVGSVSITGRIYRG